MSSGKSEDFELDDAFDEESSGDFDNDDVSKSNNVKNSLTKRRVIDDILEEQFADVQGKPALYRPQAQYVGEYCGLMGCEYSPVEKRQ